jgi:hypothetical protein
MDLAEVHQELVHEIRYGLEYVAETARIADLGGIFDELIPQLEALGLCHLLEFADEGRFRENMARSGHARRYFLRRSRLEKNQADRHLAVSRTRAFLDALIAGALPLARDIALLSTEEWNPAWEYEDDFCFYQLLHTIAKQPDPFPTPEVHALIERFERSLEGGESAHFEVSKALVARDPKAFAGALVALLEAEEAQIEADRGSAAVLERDILYWPKSRVSIEGLALLKTTELVGMRVPGEFPLCPRAARLAWTNQPFRDLFDEIERLG